MVTDELAERYGRPMPRGRRRALLATGALVLVLALGYAAWYSLTRGNPSVTWQDLSYRNTADGAEITFQVTFQNADPQDAATCTVEAWNSVRTVIGTRDVRVGPLGDPAASANDGNTRSIRMSAEIRTSEEANTALVRTCSLTS